MSSQQSPGGRRSSLPPSPLHAELVRARLVEALAIRFDMPITAVVAGPGFGKTTALAQAIRANDALPRGIDAWVACEAGDENAGRLSAAILSGLGMDVRGGSNIERLLAALRSAAPVDVCIVIDDLHELPAMSAGEQLVSELTTQLPPHAHLVLASRGPITIPLARRRAAGQVLEINAEVLAFTDAEVAGLAQLLGEDPTACDGLAGWPSLVRLALSAPLGSARQFLWEEIVAGLSPAEQSGLLALSTLGSGSADEVDVVAGRAVDVEHLVGFVPLLHRDANGRLGAHQMWEDAVERIFPPAEVSAMRRRALQVLRERGETVRMGSAAVRWRDPDMFRVACISLVRENLGVLPTDTAARWLANTPPGAAGTPERRLLELAMRHAEQRHDDNMDSELDALEICFVDVHDADAQAVALALGAVSAHARNDVMRLVTLTERIKLLPGVGQKAELQFFVDAVDAAAAALAGDVQRSLRTIEGMSFQQVPLLVSELMTRLHATMLVLAGRAEEAIPIAQPLLHSPHAYVRSIPSMVRWLAGDPSDYLAAPLSVEPLLDGNHLYRFVSAAHGAGVAASLGDRPLADAVWPDIEASAAKPLDSRDSAISATAFACCKILAHDEPAATRAIAEHLDRHTLGDAQAEARLRRNLAIAYVVNNTARQHWETAELGPAHRRARAVARDLVAARHGHLGHHAELASPSTVLTSLPLAWSVELAIRAGAAGCRDGRPLLRTLAAWLPTPTRREVEWLAEHGDTTCRTHAAIVLEDLRDLTEEPISVDVLGVLRVNAGDSEADSEELRRSRVRTLLALLVLRGPLRRERICDLLWPDLEPNAAAQNLRVTLGRLRRLLEPGRPAGQSSSLVRRNADSIELAGPPLVDTDFGRFKRHLAAADHAQQARDSTEEARNLARAVDEWRGDPFVDLASITELAGDVEYIRGSLVDACLRLGELLLVAGRLDESLHYAERGRQASPYSERAHRLAIACHLHRRDHSGLETAVRSITELLADLDVEPDDATKMLLRRADVRLGTSS